MSSGGKSSTATNRVLSMFQEWDNGTKASRARMLEDFVSTNESQTGPELELEFAQAASLFFARITAWMRLSYISGAYLTIQLKSVNIFLNAASGHRFLLEFLEVGGVLTSLEILNLKNATEQDKYQALLIVTKVVKAGRKYKEIICESYGIKAICECLARSNSEKTQECARHLLQELGQGNPKYQMQVYKGLIALLPSTSPKAQQVALQALRFMQPIVKTSHVSIVEPLLNLLRSLHLEVQFEAIELIKDLVSYDEIQYMLLNSMVKLLVPEKDVKIDRTVIFQDTEEVANIMQTTGPLPIFVQQSAVAKAIGILSHNSIEVAEKFVQLGVTHNLMIAMGNSDYADSQRQASITLEIIARTFPLVNDMVQEAMGETLYHIFMSDPDSLYLNIDTVQADILVSNKVDIPKILAEQKQ
ncbi:armadillo-like helical domain containing protein 1 [Symsagittifera roscoffensis]|uniref:armadillo-like helical domain containing protein 1 n=1 Tax=Symsagittifera roscoffensis TaxID=84072 RepID=UPI00307BA15C